MFSFRSSIAGVLLGLLATLCAVVPATAAPVRAPYSTADHAPAKPLMPVTGQSWSSPAYPVICVHNSGQVSCTPAASSDVREQQCFIGVLMEGRGQTVCTTYEGHVSALKAAGGKSLVVKFGCSVGDLVCVTFENAGRGMAMATTAAVLLVVSNISFDTSTVLWTAAVDEWSFWQWAVLAVLFGAMVWAIAAAVVSGDRAELVGAIVRTFIAVPAVPITLWAIGHLLNALDELTWYLVSGDGPIALFQNLQKVMWAGGQANYFFGFLIHGLLLLSMLLLLVAFAFRNIALAALITVGPIAWMLFPVRSVGPQWVVRYVSALVSLLLAGPLTIAFLTLIIDGLADVETIWDPQAWPLLFGLVLAAFAPFAVFSLFSFIGGAAVDAVGSRVGSGAARGVSNTARSISRMPSRLGAHPAGVPSSARGTRASTTGTTRAGAAQPAGATRPASSTASASASPKTVPATTRVEKPAASTPTRPERTPS